MNTSGLRASNDLETLPYVAVELRACLGSVVRVTEVSSRGALDRYSQHKLRKVGFECVRCTA